MKLKAFQKKNIEGRLKVGYSCNNEIFMKNNFYWPILLHATVFYAVLYLIYIGHVLPFIY